MLQELNFSMMTTLSIVISLLCLYGCNNPEDGKANEATDESEKPATSARSETDTKAVPKLDSDSNNPRIILDTTKGKITVELNPQAAPVTVKNILRYVNEEFYDGTIFHRVIRNFMIQGGGFDPEMNRKKNHSPILNEASNGLKNNRGTIAMARTNNPNSATSQFFINVKDNDFLNYQGPTKPGYAVFGKVVQGMDVVDAIVNVKTSIYGGQKDVPAEPVIIKSVVRAD